MFPRKGTKCTPQISTSLEKLKVGKAAVWVNPTAQFVHVRGLVGVGLGIIRTTLNVQELFGIPSLGVWYKQATELT